ncbi:MAG TPA: hypothetical protein VIH82_03515 [Acidimicrobiia bacterium]|jgi:hypothetical protein
MNKTCLVDLREGDVLGPLVVPVSAEASDRYWRAAGIDHPARVAGRLYPPMAANLTILLLQTEVAEPVLHTAHRLTCHGAAGAGVDLTVTGRVTERFVRRGREYAVLDAVVALPSGEVLWSSTATFTPVAT